MVEEIHKHTARVAVGSRKQFGWQSQPVRLAGENTQYAARVRLAIATGADIYYPRTA
jgi:hypothetical protein